MRLSPVTSWPTWSLLLSLRSTTLRRMRWKLTLDLFAVDDDYDLCWTARDWIKFRCSTSRGCIVCKTLSLVVTRWQRTRLWQRLSCRELGLHELATARCLSDSSALYSCSRALFSVNSLLVSDSQSALMDPTAEKECAALAAIFQQIISDMKVGHIPIAMMMLCFVWMPTGVHTLYSRL